EGISLGNIEADVLQHHRRIQLLRQRHLQSCPSLGRTKYIVGKKRRNVSRTNRIDIKPPYLLRWMSYRGIVWRSEARAVRSSLVSFDEVWRIVTASCSTFASARGVQTASQKGLWWQRG